MRPIALLILAAVLAAPLAGCGKPAEDKPASTLTEAQRDSVLGESTLPGAGAIGRAQGAAEGEATPRAELDSLTR
ncbi:MAG: hypothetical protein IT348_04760 [Candidatus Eisenbacteria bacterium]|jgi:hypothetical protein|nr:hypothetical protein [Candidatus Eisenbacteria bacterium]